MKLRQPCYLPLLCLAVASGFSTQPSAGEEPQQPSEKAQAVLREFAEHMQKLRSFSVEMSMSMSAERPDMKQKLDTRHQLFVKKPDKLALISLGGGSGLLLSTTGRRDTWGIQ